MGIFVCAQYPLRLLLHVRAYHQYVELVNPRCLLHVCVCETAAKLLYSQLPALIEYPRHATTHLYLGTGIEREASYHGMAPLSDALFRQETAWVDAIVIKLFAWNCGRTVLLFISSEDTDVYCM